MAGPLVRSAYFLFGGITGPAVGGLVVGISIRAPFFVYAATLGLATFVAMTFLRTPEQIEAARELEAHPEQASTTPVSDAGSAEDSELSGDVAVEIADDEHHHVSLASALRSGAYRAALMANLVNGFSRLESEPRWSHCSLLNRCWGSWAGGDRFPRRRRAAVPLIFAGRVTDQRVVVPQCLSEWA